MTEDIINKVIQGDCLEVMKDIPDKSIDMILCDLPYGTTACKWDTIIPFEPLWEQYKRIIKDSGAIVLTASQPFTSMLVMSQPKMYRYSWIWEKDNGTGFLSAKRIPLKIHEDILFFSKANEIGENESLRQYFQDEIKKAGLKTCKQINHLLGVDERGGGMASHYFSKKKDLQQWALPTKEMYAKLQMTGCFKRDYPNIESEYVGRVNDITYNPQMKSGKAYKITSGRASDIYGANYKSIETNNSGERYPTTILKFNRDKNKFHPTQKPVALFEYLIKTYTNEGDLVLDNCAGSGTTGIAARNLNRNFILIEKEQEYIEIINNRLNGESNLKDKIK
jgi:predicted methyltransferase